MNFTINGHSNDGVASWHKNLVLYSMMERNVPIYRGTSYVNLVKSWDDPQIQFILSKLGALRKVVMLTNFPSELGDNSFPTYYYYELPDQLGFISVNINFDEKDGVWSLNEMDIEIATNSLKLTESLMSEFSKLYKAVDSNEGKVYISVPTQGGYVLRSIGIGGLDIVETNYNETVVEDYKYISAELNKKNPNGRIVILDGQAGTGKTTLIRNLINSVDKGTFVLVPANSIEHVGDPSFLQMLITHRSEDKDPVILILEDSDRVLVPRAADNMSAISTLLNTTDGIIGNLLDLRIVATTNARIEEIDSAIMRPGRLLKQTHVGELTPDRASEAFFHITGVERLYTQETTLAQVYFDSKGATITLNTQKKRATLGFGN